MREKLHLILQKKCKTGTLHEGYCVICDTVVYVCQNSIMKGVGGTSFAPT